MVLRSKDRRFGIALRSETYKQLEGYATVAGKKETGGIIIGKYEQNQSVAVVTKVTGPPPDSESGYAWFKRGVLGLKQLLNQSWEEGFFYLGEWHFHPNANPTPSRQDMRQMKAIATSHIYKSPEPLLLIIGRSPEKFRFRVFVYTGKSNLVELFPDEFDS